MGRLRDTITAKLEKDASLKAIYDDCMSAILENRAQGGFSKHPVLWYCKVLYMGEIEIYIDEALTYYLMELDKTGFDYEKAYIFSEKMRDMFGFSVDKAAPNGYPLLNSLREWVDYNIKYPYFDKVENPDYNFYFERHKKDDNPNKLPLIDNYYNWPLKEGEPHNPISEDLFKFACYVAVCFMKYGADFDSITANRIFGYVTALGSDLPAKMKKYGSGAMPKELLEYKDNTLSCKANDAFATIKITMKEESEANYDKALDFLCTLLTADFPRSYFLDFRSPEKDYLPIKKLPKKGVNQLFANAVKYPELHGKIEQYARLAMKEFEWYTNLEDVNCAMPGTFAVFALGMLGESYIPLVLDYIKICDDEHQSVHGEFVLAYIEKYGFTEKGLALYNLCEENIQVLPSKLTTLHKKAKLS